MPHATGPTARRGGLLPAIAALCRASAGLPSLLCCAHAHCATSAARCNWPSAYACGVPQHAGYDDERASAGHSGIKSRADPRHGGRRAGMSGRAADSARCVRRAPAAGAPVLLPHASDAGGCCVLSTLSRAPRRPRAWRLSVFRAPRRDASSGVLVPFMLTLLHAGMPAFGRCSWAYTASVTSTSPHAERAAAAAG